jgi:HTH-type transcriptional regulator/antitoxin HigA
MTERRPAEAFPPGEFIRDELDERGWTQTDLAEILGRPLNVVNEIIAGKKSITPETAKGLANAFGTTPDVWLNLESAFQLWKVGDTGGDVALRAKLYSKAPVREMIKRRWIEPSNSPEVLQQRILDFFMIASLDETPRAWGHAARKAGDYSEISVAQLAWLFRARRLAPAVRAKRYTRAGMDELTPLLRTMLMDAEDIRRVPTILGDHGVRCLIVEPLPATRIDGACFWLDEHSPVVVLSMRYDRIDAFWFTLMHELAHVRAGDGLKEHEPLDTDLVGPESKHDKPEYEKRADAVATAALIAPDVIDDFIARVKPLYSKQKIRNFAKVQGVHPGIVVGQLQHRDEISYSHSREMLVKVREVAVRSALTDGWGQAIEIRSGGR